MNIFVLDLNPRLAAKYYNDKHCIKMILESVQLLMSSYYFTNSKAVESIYMYKLTHENHPCTKWINESIKNWEWVYELVLKLNSEWQDRYNKIFVTHKSLIDLEYIIKNYGLPKLKDNGLTPFVLVMPDKYKNYNDVVKSYREYYKGEKKEISTWKRGEPYWWKELD